MNKGTLLGLVLGICLMLAIGATYTIKGTDVKIAPADPNEEMYMQAFDPNDLLFQGLPELPADWFARCGRNERTALWIVSRAALNKSMANEQALRQIVQMMNRAADPNTKADLPASGKVD